jgi:hypothetical protein
MGNIIVAASSFLQPLESISNVETPIIICMPKYFISLYLCSPYQLTVLPNMETEIDEDRLMITGPVISILRTTPA